MTKQTRAVNTARFEQGDTPQGSEYRDLMDSVVMMAETTVQEMAGPLTTTVLNAQTEVSSPSGKFGAVVVTGEVSASSGSFATVSAASGFFDTLRVGGSEVLPAGAGAVSEMYLIATAATTVSSAGVFTIINGTFSAEASFQVQFSTSANGQVTYTGSDPKNFHAAAHISSRLVSGTNKDIEMRFAKNGTTLAKSSNKRRLSNATDIGSMTMGTLVALVSGDTLDCRITNLTDTINIEVGACNIIVQEA